MMTNDILSNDYCFSDALINASTYISDEQSKLSEFAQHNQQAKRPQEPDQPPSQPDQKKKKKSKKSKDPDEKPKLDDPKQSAEVPAPTTSVAVDVRSTLQ